MSALLKIGTPVKTPSIKGHVIGLHVSDDKQELQYLVEYVDLEGEVTRRHFLPEQIQEVVAPAATEEKGAV